VVVVVMFAARGCMKYYNYQFFDKQKVEKEKNSLRIEQRLVFCRFIDACVCVGDDYDNLMENHHQ
jgi:hypothetical protein